MSFSKKEIETGIYTPKNVLHKLNSELTDSERRQFLVTLASSKDLIDILITVIQNWDRLLFKQKLEIATLENRELLSSTKIEHEKSTEWALKTRTITQQILNLDEKESASLSL